MKRNGLRSVGKTIYPSPTAGRGERIEDTPLRRCVQCGTPNDTRTTTWSKGPNEAEDDGNETQQAGCKFCESTFWLKQKPVKLPDDQFLPAKENKTRMKRRGW